MLVYFMCYTSVVHVCFGLRDSVQDVCRLQFDSWSHLQKRGIVYVNYMDLLKGAATAKVADKRHRLRELIRVSEDLPAVHAAPEVPPPTAPQQDQDGQAKNWKIQKSPQLILLPASPGVSSLPSQAKLLQLHFSEGCVVLSAATLVAMVMSQAQQQTQCTLRFQQSATACVQNASLNIANVQYLASNGTSGQPPSENLQSYKQRVCTVKPQLDVCGQAVTQRVINSTLCPNPAERQSILSQYQTTFGGLDSNCAQRECPCRYRLMDELRQCYSFVNLQDRRSNRNMQPPLVSDIALIRSTLIGQNWDEVYNFCMNRQSLIQCMQQKVLVCPDAPRVLAQYDLDITAFERGIDLLCDNIGVYLAGIHCFRDPIPQVRMCFQTYERKVQNLKMIAPQPTADQISLAQFCNIRLEQIDCEMGAWAQHQYQTCERVVTGMRNELECKLLPDRCMAAFPQLVTNLCNPLNYFADERPRYNGAGKGELSVLLTTLVFVLSVVFSAQ
ncbi:hypothetical protein BaRGS_00010799 [Batillaria attramentaria]|uniref:Uncharacterized protein n=1 Tax=Batillaria attramentaria TaxID=370345 RepID=A0ABD0LFM8_9CAEN